MRLGLIKKVRVLAYSPLLYLVVFYTLVIRIKLQIGKFPYYGDDSGKIDFSFHRMLVEKSFSLSLLSIILFFILFAYVYFKVDILLKREILIFIFCTLLLLFHFLWDPMFIWFAD